uniref:Uncharacterized protein n=1 Tax=Oryza rufipogon TaxID=4529 RepID=A0A0E0R0X4_ORYRU
MSSRKGEGADRQRGRQPTDSSSLCTTIWACANAGYAVAPALAPPACTPFAWSPRPSWLRRAAQLAAKGTATTARLPRPGRAMGQLALAPASHGRRAAAGASEHNRQLQGPSMPLSRRSCRPGRLHVAGAHDRTPPRSASAPEAATCHCRAPRPPAAEPPPRTLLSRHRRP